MKRGTTPTLNFTLPFNCNTYDKYNIAFSQKDKIVLEKNILGTGLTGKILTITLTEEDTLKLNHHYPLEIQIRCGNNGTNGERMASNIIKTEVGRILKDGEL